MLVAAPDQRGTGVGRALIDFAEQHSRERGRRAMQLELLAPARVAASEQGVPQGVVRPSRVPADPHRHHRRHLSRTSRRCWPPRATSRSTRSPSRHTAASAAVRRARLRDGCPSGVVWRAPPDGTLGAWRSSHPNECAGTSSVCRIAALACATSRWAPPASCPRGAVRRLLPADDGPGDAAADRRGGRERAARCGDAAHDRDRAARGRLQQVRHARTADRPAASLSEATGGDLDRSVRHRDLKRPHGFGDELRAALVGESATWGALTLLRDRTGCPSPPPTQSSSARCRATSPRVCGERCCSRRCRGQDGRRGARRPAAPRGRQLDHAREPRRRDRGSPSCARAARTGERLPPVVTAVATRARSVADGPAAGRDRPRARPYGIGALAARAWIGARRRRRRAHRRDPRARPLARARAAHRRRLRPDRARAGRDPARRAGAADRTRSPRACTSRRGRCRTT